jgi:hypothetical protein
MAATKKLNIQPLIVSTTVTNLLNCLITTLTAGGVGFVGAQPYVLIKHIRAVNTSSNPLTVTLYKGATGASAAGTQFAFPGVTIAANSWSDFYTPDHRFDSADYLTGVASGIGIVLNVAADIGITG